jgi:hypothetical protein
MVCAPDFWQVRIVKTIQGVSAMALRINDQVPNFTAETDQGNIVFHDWIGDGWGILFSHLRVGWPTALLP